jgi:hypothetical protein
MFASYCKTLSCHPTILARHPTRELYNGGDYNRRKGTAKTAGGHSPVSVEPVIQSAAQEVRPEGDVFRQRATERRILGEGVGVA